MDFFKETELTPEDKALAEKVINALRVDLLSHSAHLLLKLEKTEEPPLLNILAGLSLAIISLIKDGKLQLVEK